MAAIQLKVSFSRCQDAFPVSRITRIHYQWLGKGVSLSAEPPIALDLTSRTALPRRSFSQKHFRFIVLSILFSYLVCTFSSLCIHKNLPDVLILTWCLSQTPSGPIDMIVAGGRSPWLKAYIVLAATVALLLASYVVTWRAYEGRF